MTTTSYTPGKDFADVLAMLLDSPPETGAMPRWADVQPGADVIVRTSGEHPAPMVSVSWRPEQGWQWQPLGWAPTGGVVSGPCLPLGVPADADVQLVRAAVEALIYRQPIAEVCREHAEHCWTQSRDTVAYPDAYQRQGWADQGAEHDQWAALADQGVITGPDPDRQ